MLGFRQLALLTELQTTSQRRFTRLSASTVGVYSVEVALTAAQCGTHEAALGSGQSDQRRRAQWCRAPLGHAIRRAAPRRHLRGDENISGVKAVEDHLEDTRSSLGTRAPRGSKPS
jgi:hypothetical protein